jgi:hypothetical protein
MAAGNDALAYKWVLINLSLSFLVIIVMNMVSGATVLKNTVTEDKEAA